MKKSSCIKCKNLSIKGERIIKSPEGVDIIPEYFCKFKNISLFNIVTALCDSYTK